MNGINVELSDMLRCRERRTALQSQLISELGCPVISFCMNIPGPIKTNTYIKAAFFSGAAALMSALSDAAVEIAAIHEIHEKTGDELLCAVHGDAELLKAVAVGIEESHPIGRLFDMDIIDISGEKLSRGSLRSCLICGLPAQECAHSRRHSVAEMQDRVETVIKAYLSTTT